MVPSNTTVPSLRALALSGATWQMHETHPCDAFFKNNLLPEIAMRQYTRRNDRAWRFRNMRIQKMKPLCDHKIDSRTMVNPIWKSFKFWVFGPTSFDGLGPRFWWVFCIWSFVKFLSYCEPPPSQLTRNRASQLSTKFLLIFEGTWKM